MTRTCTDCSKPITRQSKTGRCRRCCLAHMMADPEINAKRIANATKRCAAPEVAAKRKANLRAAIAQKMATDPDFAETRRSLGKRLAASRTGCDGRPAGHESRIRAGRKISEQKMAWCPPEWRDQHKRLIRKGMKFAAAQEYILNEIRLAEERKTPFERQMEAIKRGARLVEKPIFRRREPEFTLAGVSDWSGM